jgi:hypothetical protein
MPREGVNVSTISSEHYQRMLEEAGDDVESEADESKLRELIDERLNLLEAGGLEIGEAERLAVAADSPRERQDGQIIGIAEKKARPLTQAQMKFVQGVIEGKSRRQAYRDAYPSAQGHDATISACAARLAKDPRVQRLIAAGWEETQEALADDHAATRRYVNRSLVALSKGGKTESTRLRALELLGRAAGMFKDTAQDKAQAPITADQLRRELAGHLKLLRGGRAGGEV